MRLQQLAVLMIQSLIVATPTDLIADTVGADGFESGGFGAPTGQLIWGPHSRNVYVTTDPETGHTTIPATGKYSVGFSYRAKPPGEDASAQLRFSLSNAMPNIYVSYDIRIPENYFHRFESPGNTKWLMLWTNQYEDNVGVTVGWEYWPAKDNSGQSSVAYRWVDSDGPSPHKGMQPFIDPALHSGKWMTVVEHIRLSSGPGRTDGQIELWRRVEGGTFERIHNAEGLILWPSGGPAGFTSGYLMGWSNSGFTEETSFYIDNFAISDDWPIGTRPAMVGDVSVR